MFGRMLQPISECRVVMKMTWDLLEAEEEGARPHDEKEGKVKDSLLPGHHHSSIAAESVLARQLLPFPHLPAYHHRRHDDHTSAILQIFKCRCYSLSNVTHLCMFSSKKINKRESEREALQSHCHQQS